MTPLKTLSPNNRFCFACPIFGVEVELRGCMDLNQSWMRGENVATQRGCQAAMSSGKCPTFWILRDMNQRGTDPYHASERTVGRLDSAIVERIRPIMIDGRALDHYGVPDAEREILLAANLKAAPDAEPPRRKRKAAELDVPVEPAHVAASTGDMSVAITKAVEKAAEEAVEPRSEPTAPMTRKSTETPPASPAAPAKPLSLLERARLRQAAI